MKRVIILGPVFADIFCRGFSEYPSPGEELFLDGLDVSPGGAAITSLTLQNLGIDTELVSILGGDFFGTYILDYLKHSRSRTHNITILPSEYSGVSICFANEEDRSFLTRREPNLESHVDVLERILPSLNVEDVGFMQVNFSALKNREFYDRVVLPLLNRGNIELMTGLGHEDADLWQPSDYEALRKANWFLLNRDEAYLITGERNLHRMFSTLTAYVEHPVITLGAEGSAARDEHGEIILVKSIDAQVKNPSGSGDSFTSGLIYGLNQGYSYRESLLLGNIVGAISTESIYPFNEHISSDQVLENFRKEMKLRSSE
ncbi:MAG: carbohydrate kinase family protein [Spirochaetaceae bacterium]|nr:carbohydrate kinase family protein [Spirochaetaceae bacterium]MCF7939623.1 carbohydrate kinase family protein [Spirochaetales bacterium]